MYQKLSGLCGPSGMLLEEVRDEGLIVRLGCNRGLEIAYKSVCRTL